MDICKFLSASTLFTCSCFSVENFKGKDDKNEAKTVKLVRDPKEASRKCLSGPEQESSTLNGKLGFCDYEMPKKNPTSFCEMEFESHSPEWQVLSTLSTKDI